MQIPGYCPRAWQAGLVTSLLCKSNMEWTPGGSDQDIEDRRDESGGGGGGGFNVGGFGGVHLGIGGFLLVGALSLIFHQNLFSVFSGSGPATSSGYQSPAVAPSPAENGTPTGQDQQEQPEYQFVRFVLNDVQKFWDTTLPQQGNVAYRHARLLLYRGEYQSPCGEAQIAIGPFYCPGDQKVYLDLGFFQELETRFGAPGKFAQAYVVAHELGHHVQYLLGIEQKVRSAQEQNPQAQNQLSVKLELQADCFAGVWGHSGEQRGFVHPEDVEQGLNAASAVGDDRLQRAARGRVSPETFTHGSSAQRSGWFKRGLDSGQISQCNTFATQ